MSYSIKITGFETEQQAIDFCDWFEGQGEQDVYLGQTDLSVMTNMDKVREMYDGDWRANNLGEIELPIKIYLED
jgi:hypothetical protein